MGLKRSTSLNAIYGESGRTPLYTRCLTKIINYKRKLDSSYNNPLLYTAYTCSKELDSLGYTTWITKFRDITKKLPLNIPEPCTIKSQLVKSNIEKDFKNKWLRSICNEEVSPKLRTYKLFKQKFKFEPYLSLHSFKFRKAIAQFRTGSHWLRIETGRYDNLSKEHRICLQCKITEDEIHNMIECTRFTTQREALFITARETIPNFNNQSKHAKFISVLSSTDPSLLNALGRFLVATNSEYDYKI